MMRTLAGTVLLVFTGCAAFGQSAEAPVTFEVVSIKPSPPPDGRGMRVGGTGGPGSKDPGRWTVQNMSLSNLITQAYDLDQDGFPEIPPGQGSMMIMMNGRAKTRQSGRA